MFKGLVVRRRSSPKFLGSIMSARCVDAEFPCISQVQQYLKRCRVCLAKMKPPAEVVTRPIIPNGVMERLQIDLFRPPSADGGMISILYIHSGNLVYVCIVYCYVLTCIDVFSKFIWLFPLCHKSAAAVVECLYTLFTEVHLIIICIRLVHAYLWTYI